MQEQWEACRTAVAARMPDLAFNTWIKPLDFLGLDANECVLRLGAVTQFKADIVRNQYAELIQQVVREMIDPAVRVEIGVTPKAGGTGAAGKASATAGTGGHAGVPAARAGAGAAKATGTGTGTAAGGQAAAAHTAHTASGHTPDGNTGHAAGGPGHAAMNRHPAPGAGAASSTGAGSGIGVDTGTRAGAGTGVGSSSGSGVDIGIGSGAGTGIGSGTGAAAGLLGEAPRPATSLADLSEEDLMAGEAPADEDDPDDLELGAPPRRNTPARSFGGLSGQMPNERSRLNPGLTFEAFVNGKANDLARAAALQVADRPGSAYNPLFIHGGVGLGKTHLMQAVGNAIQAREPRAAIRYISANQFVQDLVSAFRGNSIEKFTHYYQTLDVLLIDDIQFLSDKQRSQEEFFHVFETMTINQRQIVITCDTYPKELKGIDDRMISRLNSGLIVAIEPPELEMRVAILQRKAEQARVRLPDDVAYFIAKNIRRNVRELEGALQRAIHYASFRSSPLTLELVKESLKDLISFNRGQISIDFIQKTVAEYYKIKPADMYSKRRQAKIALPRQIAMYLAKELTQKSLPEIGDAFGGKDHTTVLYAVRKITESRAHNEELNKQIHVLDQTLREYL